MDLLSAVSTPPTLVSTPLLHTRSGIPGWLHEGGERNTLWLLALFLSSKMSHKLTLLLQKALFSSTCSFYWLLGVELRSLRGWCPPTPCRGKQGSRLSLRSRSVLYTGHVSQTSWRRLTEEPLDTKTGVGWATESWKKMAGTTQQPEEKEPGSASNYQGKCNSTDQKTDAAKGRLWEPWA